MKIKKLFNGFTLIELLVTISVLGILASVMIVAVNPAHQFAKARDAERETDLVGILSAVMQYSSEHSGALPDTDGNPDTSNFPTTATCIGTDVGCFDLANAGDVGEEIVPVYLYEFPMDPKTGTAGNTGYTIYVDENGHLIASATPEASEDPIVVAR